MKKLVFLGMALALFGCGGSDANAPDAKGAADVPLPADVPRTDVPGTFADAADATPDLGKPDTTDAAVDRAPDVADAPARETTMTGDTMALDTPRMEVARQPDLAEASLDGGKGETASGIDAQKSDTATDVRADASADSWFTDGGEACACGVQLTWACFCSVENCQRTLADFVESGDGGRVVRAGQGTVVVLDYGDCNLVRVQAKTYSDYVPASEYLFSMATGTLVGATVQLDDRQHLCPWQLGDRWVFSYAAGAPLPSSCKVTGCLPGRESCSGIMDAQ